MADEQTPTQQNQSTSDATQNTEQTDDKKPVPYDRFQKVTADNSTLKAKLAEIERERDTARATAEAVEAARLKEQGDFKKLYEQTAEKLPTLEERAKAADTYETAFKDMLAARLKAVPDYLHPLLANMSPVEAMRWIDDNADKVNARNPGNPRSPDGKGVASELTDEEIAFIKQSGISEASYLRAKAAQAQPSKFVK
jgi:phage I-like protein